MMYSGSRSTTSSPRYGDKLSLHIAENVFRAGHLQHQTLQAGIANRGHIHAAAGIGVKVEHAHRLQPGHRRFHSSLAFAQLGDQFPGAFLNAEDFANVNDVIVDVLEGCILDVGAFGGVDVHARRLKVLDGTHTLA